MDPSAVAEIQKRPALSLDDAVHFGQAIEDLRNDYYEDPVFGIAQMRSLRDFVRIPLATNTVVVNFEQLAANAAMRAVDDPLVLMRQLAPFLERFDYASLTPAGAARPAVILRAFHNQTPDTHLIDAIDPGGVATLLQHVGAAAVSSPSGSTAKIPVTGSLTNDSAGRKNPRPLDDAFIDCLLETEAGAAEVPHGCEATQQRGACRGCSARHHIVSVHRLDVIETGNHQWMHVNIDQTGNHHTAAGVESSGSRRHRASGRVWHEGRSHVGTMSLHVRLTWIP